MLVSKFIYAKIYMNYSDYVFIDVWMMDQYAMICKLIYIHTYNIYIYIYILVYRHILNKIWMRICIKLCKCFDKT